TVSLSLGVAVVATTVLVEGRIYAQVADEFPKDAPSAFLLDVQTDQRDAVVRLLEERGATRVRTAPMIVARLRAVDGRDVDTLAGERGEDDRWALTREQRLTTTDTFPSDNRVVAGAAFSPATEAEVSLESRFAERIGAGLGSRVVFDVQGVPVELVVTSLREVTWESFDMNFFVVAERGPLDAAPQSVLLTAQLPAEAEATVQDTLAARFPNVTLVRVRAAIEQARGLLEKLGTGIRAVGAFTAVAGVAILVSGLAADATRQRKRVALLKTLGTTRAGVVALFAVEYGLLGLFAGALGALGAVGISWAIVTRMMRLDWRTDFAALAITVAASAVACAAVGVAANARALRVRPAEVLRAE
ncbi:MAG: ABC transporter permease, partial [Myxococcota bacterium]